MSIFFKAFRGMNPRLQLIMAVFLMIVFFFIVSALSVPVAIAFFGSNEVFNAWGGHLEGAEGIELLKYIQTTQSVGLFVVPPLVIGWLYEGNAFTYLHLNSKVYGRSLWLAFVLIIFISPLVSVLGEWNSHLQLPGSMAGIQQWMQNMEDKANGVVQQFMEVHSVGGILFNYLMIAILPAFGEEFLFRGVLQNIFIRMTRNFHGGIWVTAFLFSAIHMQFFGFLPRMVLGAVFGYLVFYSGSLWLAVLCHFINNAVAVTSMLAAQKGYGQLGKLSDFTNVSPEVQLFLALISLVGTLWILRRIRAIYKRP